MSANEIGSNSKPSQLVISSKGFSTTVLRYIHLYDDLHKSGKLSQTGLKTMLLGLGLCKSPDHIEEVYITPPQAVELSLLMNGMNQVLHLVDNNQEVLDRLDFDQYPIHSARHFFDTLLTSNGSKLRLMKPRSSKDSTRLMGIIKNICESFAIKKYTPQKSFLWDPQTVSSLPSEINDTYDVVVATCSALFPSYISKNRVTPTWIKILSLLKNNGVLYVDKLSYQSFIKRKETLETVLKSHFHTTKISKLVEIEPSAEEVLKKEFIVGRSTQTVVVFGKEGKGFTLGNGASSQTIYKIERVIDSYKALISFSPRDPSTFLHFVAKTISLDLMYQQPAMLQRLQDAEQNYTYASEQGLTPLHVAVLSNNRAALRYLLSKQNPLLEQEDCKGMKPVEYARVYQPHLHQEFWPAHPNLESLLIIMKVLKKMGMR